MISSLSEKNCKVMKKEETISTSGVSLSVFLIRNVIPAESVFWLISSYCIHLFLLLAYEISLFAFYVSQPYNCQTG